MKTLNRCLLSGRLLRERKKIQQICVHVKINYSTYESELPVQQATDQGDMHRVREVLHHTDSTAWELGDDTPPITLRLITPQCSLYASEYRDLPQNWELPWWGFLWPGGFGIAQHVMKHKDQFTGRRVIDIASGCGVAGIAAVKAGAASVVANEICPHACSAIAINAALNGIATGEYIADDWARALTPLRFTTLCQDILASDVGTYIHPGDVVLVGDALYDSELANVMLPWLRHLTHRNVDVFIGDPDRWVLQELERENRLSYLKRMESYSLPPRLLKENRGISRTTVYRVLPTTNEGRVVQK
eukprot:m.41099 g.41099  ORF g.41099 m.41099 type:complete len:303 (-) comp14894_c0_seq8:22-930(-)